MFYMLQWALGMFNVHCSSPPVVYPPSPEGDNASAVALSPAPEGDNASADVFSPPQMFIFLHMWEFPSS